MMLSVVGCWRDEVPRRAIVAGAPVAASAKAIDGDTIAAREHLSRGYPPRNSDGSVNAVVEIPSGTTPPGACRRVHRESRGDDTPPMPRSAVHSRTELAARPEQAHRRNKPVATVRTADIAGQDRERGNGARCWPLAMGDGVARRRAAACPPRSAAVGDVRRRRVAAMRSDALCAGVPVSARLLGVGSCVTGRWPRTNASSPAAHRRSTDSVARGSARGGSR